MAKILPLPAQLWFPFDLKEYISENKQGMLLLLQNIIFRKTNYCPKHFLLPKILQCNFSQNPISQYNLYSKQYLTEL